MSVAWLNFDLEHTTYALRRAAITHSERPPDRLTSTQQQTSSNALYAIVIPYFMVELGRLTKNVSINAGLITPPVTQHTGRTAWQGTNLTVTKS
jgi:hypothetical protein